MTYRSPLGPTRVSLRNYNNPITIAKKRPHSRGENNGRAVLTWAKVEAIRSSDETCPALAARYNVHPSTIHLVRRNKIWRIDEAQGELPL